VSGVRCQEKHIVILSEAKDLLSPARPTKQVLRFAQDDNLELRAEADCYD